MIDFNLKNVKGEEMKNSKFTNINFIYVPEMKELTDNELWLRKKSLLDEMKEPECDYYFIKEELNECQCEMNCRNLKVDKVS